MNQSEPGRDAADPHIEELMVRYWDGTLDEPQLAELNGALAGRPELRALFNNLGLQILAISERSAAEKACLSGEQRGRSSFLPDQGSPAGVDQHGAETSCVP